MSIKKSLTYDKLMKGQKVLSYCVIADPSARETTTNYQKLMDRLMVSKDEGYKRSILSLLNEDSKDTKKHDKEPLEMNKTELYKIAKSLGIKYYTKIKKDKLVQEIAKKNQKISKVTLTKKIK